MAIVGASAVNTMTNSANLINVGAPAVSNLANIGSSIMDTASSEGIGSAIRLGMSDLPSAGESIGDITSAIASFSSLEGANEWRVRLSLPTWGSFRNSPALAPLKSAGGMIFPYTPEISFSSSAKYTPMNLVHTNYNFQAYQHSEPGQITITAPMNVEDQTQGLYWVAAVHYLRSMTKMFAGSDPKAGNPPPIVYLNGYGNYVFANVPVAVVEFSMTLPKDCDYIGVPVVGSMSGAIQGISDSIGGLSDSIGGALGGAVPGLSDITGGISAIAGGVGAIAGLAGSLGLGGSTSGGVTHVPTKSTMQIKLQPMYSRQTAVKFSLDRFVGGGYLSSKPGYI